MSRQLIARDPASIINMVTSEIAGYNAEEVTEEIRILAIAAGIHKVDVNDLKKEEKAVLARLKEKHRAEIAERNKGKEAKNREKDTDGRIEALALADPEYTSFRKNLSYESKKLVELQANHDKATSKHDFLIEQMKLARQEMHYLQQSSQTL